MSKVTMSVSQHGSATSYKFSEPVSREHADAMIQMHKNAEDAKRVSLSIVFYAMGPQCWGKGRTLNEAFKNCRDNYSGRARSNKIFSAWKISRDDGTELNFRDIRVSDIDGAFGAPKGCTITKLQTSTLAVQS